MSGLILEGGGLRAGFVAGALMALMDMGLNNFDVAIAVSASVPTLAYSVAGQRKEMEEVWREELNTTKLVRYRNIPAATLSLSIKRPILDIDYLVYEVFKKKYPLNVQRLLQGTTLCRFAVTNFHEGCLTFLSPGEHNIYKTFKAALAVPGAYPSPVCIDDCEYVDGGTVNPLPASALLDNGVARILAILSKPLRRQTDPPNFLERTILWRYLHRYEWMMEKLWESADTYKEQVFFLKDLAERTPASALIIRPDDIPPAAFITRDKRKINRTIDMGYRKARDLENAIRIFLKNPYQERISLSPRFESLRKG